MATRAAWAGHVAMRQGKPAGPQPAYIRSGLSVGTGLAGGSSTGTGSSSGSVGGGMLGSLTGGISCGVCKDWFKRASCGMAIGFNGKPRASALAGHRVLMRDGILRRGGIQGRDFYRRGVLGLVHGVLLRG